jgi:hypothetical protein
MTASAFSSVSEEKRMLCTNPSADLMRVSRGKISIE